MYPPTDLEKLKDGSSNGRRRSSAFKTPTGGFMQVCHPRSIYRYRPFALLAAACLTVLVFFQTFHVHHHGLVRSPYSSVSAQHPYGFSSWEQPQSRVKKITALFGQENEFYEAALQTHEKHNALHGYEIDVLRTRILNNFWSKPAYLLSKVIEELAKPEEQRVEWLMWVETDIMILNPQIPLELFLPPDDFEDIHFVGTRDDHDFNSGSFFLRVSDWSVKMLIEVLALPKTEPSADLGLEKDQGAFDSVLRGERFRQGVVYQPRLWFNAYQKSVSEFEGYKGSLLVHFHDLGGDKWVAMSNTLASQKQDVNRGNVPLEQTPYEQEVEAYWDRLRRVDVWLGQVGKSEKDEELNAVANWLRWTRDFDTDRATALENGLHELQRVLKSPRKSTE